MHKKKDHTADKKKTKVAKDTEEGGVEMMDNSEMRDQLRKKKELALVEGEEEAANLDELEGLEMTNLEGKGDDSTNAAETTLAVGTPAAEAEFDEDGDMRSAQSAMVEKDTGGITVDLDDMGMGEERAADGPGTEMVQHDVSEEEVML